MSQVQILIADDHELFRRSLRGLLESRRGWRVCGEASNGEEAVAKAKQLRPQLILMDVSMPCMDGVQATRIIRKEVPESDVIIVSQNDPETQLTAVEAGAKAFISKAKLGQDLFRTIEGVVKGAEKSLDPNSEVDRAIRLLAAIVNSSDDAIVSKNLDGVITSWNKSAERIFGYTAEEAVGQHITLIIPKNRLEEENEIIARLRRGERIEHFETVRVRKDGSTVDLSLTISPVKDAAGRVIGASKVARDITERKRAEERERHITAEALAAKAKFHAVFEQTTQFAGIMNKDGTLIEVNKLALDACGYRSEEVLGKPFWETNWWRNDEESRNKIRKATQRAAQGIPYREELRYSWADGSERLIDFALYPIFAADNEVLFLHPTGVDITDRKRNEANYRKLVERLDLEVQSRTRELEERNADVLRQSEQLRELSWQLLRVQDEERRHIARELHDSAGQTLTVLGMNLAMLVQKAGRDAPKLAGEAEKIQALVQQLHREIRTASYLLHPPLLDESGLTSALNWYVQGLVERSGLDITLDIAEDFGRVPHDMELIIFRLVQECLTNIHRHSGSKTGRIGIARDRGGIAIEIRDQGKGIPPQQLAEIQSGRSGVGICGMRERLRKFHGKLNVESGSSGTRVSVTIPLAQGALEETGGGSLPRAV
jgi:PAS domain S-box-containing protein